MYNQWERRLTLYLSRVCQHVWIFSLIFKNDYPHIVSHHEYLLVIRFLCTPLPLFSACPCIHGECENRPDSDGSCKAYTCQATYTGKFCERHTQACGPSVEFCHAHASCDFNGGAVRWAPRLEFGLVVTLVKMQVIFECMGKTNDKTTGCIWCFFAATTSAKELTVF